MKYDKFILEAIWGTFFWDLLITYTLVRTSIFGKNL